MSSMLKQTVLQHSSLPHIIREAYKTHSCGTLKLSLSEVVELFHGMYVFENLTSLVISMSFNIWQLLEMNKIYVSILSLKTADFEML